MKPACPTCGKRDNFEMLADSWGGWYMCRICKEAFEFYGDMSAIVKPVTA